MQATARHEAAHAVAGLVAGAGDLYMVTIEPTNTFLGRCRWEWMFSLDFLSQQLDQGGLEADCARAEMEQRIIISLAGPIAQHMFEGATLERDEWTSDHQEAFELLWALGGCPLIGMDYFARRTRALLRRKPIWGAIERLAEELLRRRTLEGRALSTFVFADGGLHDAIQPEMARYRHRWSHFAPRPKSSSSANPSAAPVSRSVPK